jgi:5'-3' exonuclease
MKYRKNILVDGNNLLHRAYAIYVKDKSENELMKSSRGFPTGLIYGFFSMLYDWVLSISSPTSMSLFWDGTPLRRLNIDPSYKFKELSERPGTEPNTIILFDGFSAANELDVINHIAMLCGISVYRHENEEADDLIASYIKQNTDDVNIIISSDRDFYQLLVNDKVILYRPGISGNRFFDAERAAEDMLKKYKVRIQPSQIRMFKSLTGDRSDGINGVPRLRKKVAAHYCSYESVDSLFDSGLSYFSEIERKRANSMKDRIKLNYELVKLFDDISISDVKISKTPDFDTASRILNELDIQGVYPRAFEFGSSNIRVSTPSFDLLPDWLKDI